MDALFYWIWIPLNGMGYLHGSLIWISKRLLNGIIGAYEFFGMDLHGIGIPCSWAVILPIILNWYTAHGTIDTSESFFWMDLSGMDFLVLVSTGPEHPQTNHHPTGVLNTAQMDLNGISMVICWVFQFVDFLLALTKTGSLTTHRRILNRILWNPFRGLASTQIFQPSDEFWWNLKKIAYIQRSNIIVLNPWICFHIMCSWLCQLWLGVETVGWGIAWLFHSMQSYGFTCTSWNHVCVSVDLCIDLHVWTQMPIKAAYAPAVACRQPTGPCDRNSCLQATHL